MNNYEKFQSALTKRKEDNYRNLVSEVKIVEQAIEKFLSKALECSASMAEQDFLVSAL